MLGNIDNKNEHKSKFENLTGKLKKKNIFNIYN